MLKQMFEYLSNLFKRPKYGILNITIIDPINRPISNATVQILSLNKTLTTDITGKASLKNIPYNTYTVKITT